MYKIKKILKGSAREGIEAEFLLFFETLYPKVMPNLQHVQWFYGQEHGRTELPRHGKPWLISTMGLPRCTKGFPGMDRLFPDKS